MSELKGKIELHIDPPPPEMEVSHVTQVVLDLPQPLHDQIENLTPEQQAKLRELELAFVNAGMAVALFLDDVNDKRPIRVRDLVPPSAKVH